MLGRSVRREKERYRRGELGVRGGEGGWLWARGWKLGFE